MVISYKEGSYDRRQEEYLEIITGRLQQQLVKGELSDCAASVGKEADKRDG